MNIDASKKFMNRHKDQIFNLFLRYQMIEMLLFMHLYFPDVPKDDNRDTAMIKITKELNTKTFGKLRSKYLKRFPGDDYNLASDLISVGGQRNAFMHSLWLTIALMDSQEKTDITEEDILNDFTKNADNLFDKVLNIPI